MSRSIWPRAVGGSVVKAALDVADAWGWTVRRRSVEEDPRSLTRLALGAVALARRADPSIDRGRREPPSHRSTIPIARHGGIECAAHLAGAAVRDREEPAPVATRTPIPLGQIQDHAGRRSFDLIGELTAARFDRSDNGAKCAEQIERDVIRNEHTFFPFLPSRPQRRRRLPRPTAPKRVSVSVSEIRRLRNPPSEIRRPLSVIRLPFPLPLPLRLPLPPPLPLPPC